MRDRSGKSDPLADHRFLARVSWAYYVEGLTQEKIAAQMGSTRLRINKALAEAKRLGIVRISIDTRHSQCFDLEARLTERFGLGRAHVTPEPLGDTDTQTMVGAALGHLLTDILRDPAVRRVGMGWGGTLNIAMRHVAPLARPDVEVVSAMVGLVEGSETNCAEITARLADLLGARRRYFPAPLFAGSAASRDAILEIDVFRTVLEGIRSCDVLVLATSDISDRNLLIRSALPGDITAEDLRAAGAVGDILGTVIDAHGQPIDHAINRRVIGIGLDDLYAIPDVVLAGGGAHKVTVLRALLGRGFVDTLVTDAATARGILDMP
ncbi:sugar-binding transcriptional regulator [Jannaschia rubra]|uniref:sugar-binding transcriptional regulator n=1 Tax=Jannaschia rubra TaxID=282197 RepID=UPI0024937FCF|nr:sugar-binding transcriptional regulator [Jannaschia rubra]